MVRYFAAVVLGPMLILGFASSAWAVIDLSTYYDPLVQAGNTWTYNTTVQGTTYEETFTVEPGEVDINGASTKAVRVSRNDESSAGYTLHFYSSENNSFYYHGNTLVDSDPRSTVVGTWIPDKEEKQGVSEHAKMA